MAISEANDKITAEAPKGSDKRGALRYTDCIKPIIENLETYLSSGDGPYDDISRHVHELGLNIQSGISQMLQDFCDELKKLVLKLDELDEKSAPGYQEFKKFLTDNQLSVEIMEDFLCLKKSLNDCLKLSDDASIDGFRAAYKRTCPLTLACSISNLLKYEFTNPLLVAMEKDLKKLKTTFKFWEYTIKTFLWDLFFIESFARGLLNIRETWNSEQILKKSEQISKQIEKWEEPYFDNETYWEEWKNKLTNYFATHTNMNNEQKADDLKKELRKAWTNEPLYICVINEVKSGGDFYLYCVNRDAQLIEVKETGKCNAFIYRSRNARKMVDSGFKAVEDEVKQCGKLKFGTEMTTEQKASEVLKQVRSDGLVALLGNWSTSKLRVVNGGKREKGHGHWGYIQGYTLLVGLP
ncbi:hypothetical protein CAEBREN_25931 [Caenorhabditis brenneri]|uniref:Uncharacterized protein n=1 Tax=Caenorhabditis brenneri TaxID=135651 RepID=G0P418_CAEBE|nr:hypothetical protein CAEBREN_25931 [Caenorhabditis brenneri]